MGVPLVLPHTSLTIPARSLHNLTIASVSHTFFVVLDGATKYTPPYRDPKQPPFALRE